jgi:hypothetical protein
VEAWQEAVHAQILEVRDIGYPWKAFDIKKFALFQADERLFQSRQKRSALFAVQKQPTVSVSANEANCLTGA